MAFRDQVSDRQTVAAIAPGDLSDQPQMANDEPVSGVAITGVTPALGQHVFFLRVQHREPLDVLIIMVDAGFGRSEEHTSELQSRRDLVCRLLLEKKKKK